MSKYKVIIAGSRDFEDYYLLRDSVKEFLKGKRPSEVEIVSGAAKGADRLGEVFAMDNGIDVKRFPADWNSLGRSAGPIRNAKMAEYADACIVFWDGKSRGTEGMIKLAKSKELDTNIIIYTSK